MPDYSDGALDFPTEIFAINIAIFSVLGLVVRTCR
jgi:hypothetical protein